MRGLFCLPLCLLLACSQQQAQTKEKLPDVKTPENYKEPDAATMKKLAKEDPVAFLEHCAIRYNSKVKGYRLMFHKKERINGELKGDEEIEVAFRDKPHSVFFHWVKGAGRAVSALYVEGENGGKMLIRPNGIGGRLVKVAERDPEGKEAKQSGRYSLKEFGLKNATLRAIATWKAAKEDKALHVEFLGEEKVKQAGNRTCWVLKRTKYKKPENDGVTETTLYFDKETWLQVGSVLRGEDGQLIGEYFFRDIELNPKFKDKDFQRDALVEKKPK
jgi:hypothetical protein